MKLNIALILGTAREGRQSETVARFVFAELQKQPEVTAELIDIRDHLKSYTKRQSDGAAQDDLQKKIIATDAFVIVSPEYNHGYPGELKIFLDTFYKEYNRRPVAIIGVSNGPIGGARAVQQLRQIAVAVGLVPVQKVLYFPNMPKPFDEHGNVTDETYTTRLHTMLEELCWFGRALKTAREATE